MSLKKARQHLTNSYFYQYGAWASHETNLAKAIREMRYALYEIHEWASQYMTKAIKNELG